MNRQSVAVVLVIIAMTFGVGIIPAFAQEKPADNMQVLREKLQADKKLLIAQNMALTESEAEKFWPAYDAFQQDLTEINRQMAGLIQTYAENSENLADADAEKMVNEFIAIQEARADLYKSHLSKFKDVLPMKKVARYYQLENKINAAVTYGLAEQIPLIQ